MTKANNKRNISENFLNQMNVLKVLSGKPVPALDPRPFQINEIAELSGVKDEKEIQRYLFILEGQKLVTPQPEGDFTSKTWVITRDGLRVVKRASNSSMI